MKPLHRVPQPSSSRRWRASAVLLSLSIIVAGCGEASTNPSQAVGIDSPIANLAFIHPDGSEGQLADHYGQPLVVNFFAGWCPPCKAELPDINAVHLAAGDDVKVLGISHDLSEDDWQELVSETNIDFETVFQPDREIFIELRLFGMPSTILINPEGEVVHTHSGILNAETLRSMISEYLDVEVSA